MRDVTLAELLIVACSEVWRGNGEILASGIGIIPGLGCGLAKLTHTPELLITDREAFLVEEPIPLGTPLEDRKNFSGYMSYARVFDVVWHGSRHAMITPVQIDRYGQTNLSLIGDYDAPKAAILGPRGLPGNSINHLNSLFIPSHSTKVFVTKDEVDMVCGVGHNPKRWQAGMNNHFMKISYVVTDLCVMDFQGPEQSLRVISLHPGVTFAQVQAATGFPLVQSPDCQETALPTEAQLALIEQLDPKNWRATTIKGNPPAIRS